MMSMFMGFDPRRAAKFAGLGLLILFLSWQHVQATRLGYQVESSRKRARQARSRVAGLRLTLDQTLSPSMLAARASSMGMVAAAPESLRVLSSGATDAHPSRPLLWARNVMSLVTPARS